uniref:Uncharacterized protein n=1 Tax=viral metagenome TaxID=1070528 RepID=A0A6C0CDQ8_9ZZZZ
MFCCSKKRVYKIHPEKQKVKRPTIIEDQLSRQEFTEQFIGEVLSCGTCNKSFSLRENELVATCGGCYKFLHCGIAGKCVGPNCLFKIKGEDYRETWCVKCVPNNIMINVVDIGSINNDCLCRECLNDPKTPKKFKRGLY